MYLHVCRQWKWREWAGDAQHLPLKFNVFVFLSLTRKCYFIDIINLHLSLILNRIIFIRVVAARWLLQIHRN